jgi:hypothetical protein
MPFLFPSELAYGILRQIDLSQAANYENLSSTMPESEISVITTTCRLVTINSIDITTSFPYTNLKGVYPVNFLIVVLHAHNIVGTLKY